MSTANSHVTIEKMRLTFASWGLPDLLVTDNGTVFTSSEFQVFLANGIGHARTSPYHPSSNGLAEHAVQTFNEGMKKNSPGTVETRLARFLFHYRITPHMTGRSLSEILMGRQLKSHLDLLNPSVGKTVQLNQRRQKSLHDRTAHRRQVKTGDAVLVRHFAGIRCSWVPGLVVAVRGPLTYEVRLDDSHVFRRHIDHLRLANVLVLDKSTICTLFKKNMKKL